ncbi:ABC-type transport auxiliary lipoprotein family protein [Pelagibacterium xiamenense]|uniref:ABC-type transport auxiliary lipoprotein family protein n=1 Tax=Pelagibacterium xiamenense TaxID=2901140 RepID=UPI001E3A5808|nr:ABC-type transport auxiliary lipoprotein family protein [Pelagibacterium xiamenense]MCD7059405.1 ABC-type transport auxiliary lipoprotein family protein [Pelagibacterium xiamenense]
MGKTYGRRAFLTLSAMGLTTALAGCFGARQLTTYDLTAAAQAAVPRRSNRTVIVDVPDAIQIYDSERIVVREPGGVLSYLADSQWSDVLPRLVQTRMLQSFRDAGVANIGAPSDPLDAEVILATDVRAFELDTSRGAAMARVSLAVRLVDDWDRRIIASQTFSADVPASSLNAPTVVAALNTALDSVIVELVAWTAARA